MTGKALRGIGAAALVMGLVTGCNLDTGSSKHHFSAHGNGSQHKHKAPKQQSNSNGLSATQQSAVDKAGQYLDGEPGFSRGSLIEQLKYEGFSTQVATFAVDHITVNWNQQAVAKAKAYMKQEGGFSRASLIQQLEYEKFTPAQANYAANQVGLH